MGNLKFYNCGDFENVTYVAFMTQLGEIKDPFPQPQGRRNSKGQKNLYNTPTLKRDGCKRAHQQLLFLFNYSLPYRIKPAIKPMFY